MAEGGSSPSLPENGLGDPCSDNGALSCNGAAQKLSLLCKGGVWIESTICESNESCDQTTGVCTPILADCEDKIGGQLYCGADDAVFQCGPDLVSTVQVEMCVGKCVPSAASATCAPITCGDGKVQSLEDCDDGNDDETDACTNACTDAACGDGSIWKDHETCDDGNDKSDDDCLATCVAATCGDGFIQLGHETCDGARVQTMPRPGRARPQIRNSPPTAVAVVGCSTRPRGSDELLSRRVDRQSVTAETTPPGAMSSGAFVQKVRTPPTVGHWSSDSHPIISQT